PQPPVTKPEVLETPAKLASIAPSVPIPTPTPERSAKPRVGWIIQVGALPDEKEARQRLETAQSKAKDILGRADPFTERIEKGDKVLFRARFAGLEKNQAEAACKHLKRSDIPCMLLKN
ncbi:MAG TPA: SPOR domain-containing protein, partial [Pseudolabrys sp.]|nr:SPOR domain-containing protein [Pseudolabrys sp.]